jgi:RNA polymerase sigma-70 factor (ECF subfamily)
MEGLMVEPEKDFKSFEDEKELIQKAKQGNLYFFEQLVKRYQKKIYRLAFRMTKDHDSADDIAQETFVKAFTSIRSFKEEHSFYPWIFRICINLSINYLKRKKFVLSESEIQPQKLEEKKTVSDPMNQLIRNELKDKINSSIDQLPPPFKAVFILKVYEELSYEEIAQTLNISVGTVMSRLFRARERLQRSLKDYI